METYTSVERVVDEFGRTNRELRSIVRQIEELQSKPEEDPVLADIIINAQQHDYPMIDVRDVAYKQSRLRVLNKQREEKVYAMNNHLSWLSRNLLPNRWYVFEHYAFINVFYVDCRGNFHWRVDYESFENRGEYLAYNKHNMDPLEDFGDSRPVGIIEWYLKYSQKS